MTGKTIRKAMLVLLTGLCLAGAANAQSRKDKEKLARYDKDIKDIKAQIKALESNSSTATKQLQLINAELDVRKAALNEATAQLDSITREIRVREHRLDSLSLRLDTLKTRFSSLLRAAYKTRGTRHWYLYVFSGDSFMQGIRRARYMRSLGDNVREEAGRIREVKQVQQEEKALLDSLRIDSESLTARRMAEVKDIQQSRNTAQKLVDSIKKDKAGYEASLQKKIRERDALKKEIDAAIAAAREAEKKSSSKSTASSGSKKKAGGTAAGSTEVDASLGGKFNADANKGKLPWPAKGYVVEQFGDNVDPVFHTKIHSDGITLSVQPGAEVRAIYEGVVTSAVKSKSKFNYIVIIKHGGNFRTIYCCLDDNIKVKAGDKVKTGQLLGHAVVTGGTSEVFFQIRNASDAPVDPRPWLRK
ncbi:MAG: peptidoglycan DD-metalloendopeptidase family protein [Bacteroidota bacterium]|nr:peptidoglycan DD-metalloendopeptidase family protein [Bacteroidota bacterium]